MKDRITGCLHFSLIFIHLLLFTACKLSGPSGIFGKRSPHELYEQKLADAGLKQTALGKIWFSEADKSLRNPLQISVPYKETGYFAAEHPHATALRFETKRGQKLTISLEKNPVRDFTVYVDLWQVKNNTNKKLVAYADSSSNPFSYDIDEEGVYLLRLQPELLVSGDYTLSVSTGPSLAFPVKNGKIGSFWGDDRDAGSRRHEGIDIFAAKHSPALAAANGYIDRVDVNKLGGKVIFLRPEGKNYNLYYAHLDEQLVKNGQKVKVGDTIGLVGNTGNAVHTASHLHFGIYTFGGAINPLPFVDPDVKRPAPVAAPVKSIGKSMRTVSKPASLLTGPDSKLPVLQSLKPNTILSVNAASRNWYKVSLPNGMEGFVDQALLRPAGEALRTVKLQHEQNLLNKPDTTAARIKTLTAGTTVDLLGSFNSFYYVSEDGVGGWLTSLE